jgi:hypothetical protein
MKLPMVILASALASLGAAPQSTPVAADKDVAELAGRTAGKPQRCVSVKPGRLFSTSDSNPNLLLYDDGKTIWVSDVGPNCGFEGGESAIPDESSSYYCQGDFVRPGSRITLLPFGRHCALRDFTPYRK